MYYEQKVDFKLTFRCLLSPVELFYLRPGTGFRLDMKIFTTCPTIERLQERFVRIRHPWIIRELLSIVVLENFDSKLCRRRS